MDTVPTILIQLCNVVHGNTDHSLRYIRGLAWTSGLNLSGV